MRDRSPAPETHEVCSLLLAWSRHEGVPDSDLYALAEGMRTIGIRFFDWDRHPVDLSDGRLIRVPESGQKSRIRRDIQWDGSHLALRAPIAPGVMLSSGSIRIDTELPLSMMTALVGRPLRDLVDTPFRIDATIASAVMGEGLVVEIDPRWSRVSP